MIYFCNMYDTLILNDHSDYSFSNKVSLEDIKAFIDNYRKNGKTFTFREFSIDSLRFDFLSLNPCRRLIEVMEFKTSVSDFMADRKWRSYLFYCNYFSFVMPLGMIPISCLESLKEIGCGVLEVFRWGRRSGRRSGLGGIWLQKPKRRMSGRDYGRVADIALIRLLKERNGYEAHPKQEV